MLELTRDAAMLATILVGAAFQRVLDGPWLVFAGSLALALRITWVQDDRRGIWSTLAGCLVWFLLHWAMGSLMTRLQVAADIVTFSGFCVLFWIARLRNRERNQEAGARWQAARERVGELEARVSRLRAESENLGKESEEWTRLFGVTKQAGEAIREADLVEVIRDTVRDHLRLPSFVFLLSHDGELRVRAQEGFDAATLEALVLPVATPSLGAWFMRQREPVLVDSLEADPRFAGTLFPYRSLVLLPLSVRDEPAGALVAFDSRGRTFNRNDYNRAWILTKQLSLGVGKTLLYERVEELSITDGLTKLYRHRYFQDRFDTELERARRYARPLTMLLSDLDHFKRYNDAFGHVAGDELLQHVSRTLEQCFKRPAIIGRYGGEEFAVLMPDTTAEDAATQAEAFRRTLAEAPAPGGEGRPVVTISIGLATFPRDAQTRRDLIARADLALYRAKRDGRDRVQAYEPSFGTGLRSGAAA